MKSAIKSAAKEVINPIAGALAAVGVTPNHLTFAGLLASIGSAFAVAGGRFGQAAMLLALGGLCDMLDGAVARHTGGSTRFGAHFDSSMDRLAEGVFFTGMLIWFHRGDPSSFFIAATALAMIASFSVSYTRARAEGLGIDCSVGVMERPERLVLLILGCVFGSLGLKIALWILTPLALFTTYQRMRHVFDAGRDS